MEAYENFLEHATRVASLSKDNNVSISVFTVLNQQLHEMEKIKLSANVIPQGRYVARAPRGKSVAKPKVEVSTTPSMQAEGEYFVRPNGSKYFARQWGVHQDIATLREARKATTRSFTEGGISPMFALLYGSPGTGKTALVEGAFNDVYTILGSGDTEVADFVGGYTQKPSGGFEWVDGALVKAVENGGVLFVDEIGLIDPKVLSIVYGVMDGRREFEITANPSRGTIKVHPDFYVVAATNPNAIGVRLSEALLSRFTIQAEMTTDWALAKQLGVPSYLITVATNLSKKVDSGEMMWSPQMRELLAFRDIEGTFGQEFAIQNLLASAPEMERAKVADVLSRAIGMECKPARI